MTNGILHEVKVADFTTAIAGPLTTRYLAAHGATVVRVECHKYPCSVRFVPPFKDNLPGIDRSTQFAFYNFSKRSLSIDIKEPHGMDVATRLVAWSDIVVENIAPGAMARLGLDYESCRRIKSDIIYLSSSSLGREGPLAGYSAWGYHHGPLAGFSHLTGWPDRPPCADSIAFTDTIAPSFSFTALVGALLRRRRTGKGAYIDQSQTEAGLYFLGPTHLDWQANGVVATRRGNRDPQKAPHGIFPCRGNERWVAIAVSDDAEWRRFGDALGGEVWPLEERFATVETRQQHEDELEALIGQWTARRTPEEVTDILQSAGVAAGIVASAEDLFNDAQLEHRHHFGKLQHPLIGQYSYELPSFRFSRVPPQPQQPAPLLGEDNEFVLKEILGFSDDDIAELFVQGAITTEADLPAGP